MKFTPTRAIIACTLLAGLVAATPAFSQSYGIIARGDCPKAARLMARTHTPAPSMSSYKPVAELERYIASLQAAAPAEPQPREHSRPKRARSLPRPF